MFTNRERLWERRCDRLDGITDRNQLKSYWGSFKIRPGSSSRQARDERLDLHRKAATPWFRWVRVESLLLEPMGPVLSWQQGLVEEAILAASHMAEHRSHRGGTLVAARFEAAGSKPDSRGG